MKLRQYTASAMCAIVATGTASAAFNTTIFQVADLTPFTNLVQTLDITSTPYNFPFQTPLFTSSGYVRSLPDGTELDRTQLVSSVFEVTQQVSLGTGVTLNAGDMVFSYEIRLVSTSTNTVDTMDEFQVQGFSSGPADIMEGSLIKGRGVLAAAAGVDSPLGGTALDFSDFGQFGSILDFQWSEDPTLQLDNSETITLLMFTSHSGIGTGQANLLAPLSTSLGSFDPRADGAPVLIPIAMVPAPGGASLLTLGLAGWSIRRRRRNG